MLILACLLSVAFLVFEIAAFWKVFAKARQPGWGCLIPIYNLYLLLKITGRPGWWLLLFLIPIVSLVLGIMLYLDLAKSFGRGVGFGLGLLFLNFIFVPILGFGDSKYEGPAAA
jgi:hypothetical protein